MTISYLGSKSSKLALEEPLQQWKGFTWEFLSFLELSCLFDDPAYIGNLDPVFYASSEMDPEMP